jgi:hypothetical protein
VLAAHDIWHPRRLFSASDVLTLLAAIVFFTFVPPAFRPATGSPHVVEHAMIFFLTVWHSLLPTKLEAPVCF